MRQAGITIPAMVRIGECEGDCYGPSMRHSLVLALSLTLSAAPVQAAQCVWQSEHGVVLAEIDPSTISISEGGDTRICNLRGSGTGATVRVGSCGDLDWAYFTVPSVPGGLHDILIFQNTAWYRECAQ